MKNFRTHDLSIKFYKSCQTLKLPNHLKDQLSRASSSVALNLAEGNARRTTKDRARFYRIAYASCKESQTILQLADNSNNQQRLADTLGAHLYKLCKAMES